MDRFKNLTISCLLLVFACSGISRAQEFLAHRSSFQLKHWKFYEGEIYSGEEGRSIDTTGWKDVTVPYTYNGKDVLTRGPRFYQGVAWYRTKFVINREPGKRYFVRFQGACLVTDVFFNGVFLGTHKGGYAAFIYEITPYIRGGKMNYLSVKTDNSTRMNVAPSGTWLYPLFGGIYRPVTVFSTSDLCISPLDYASSGVYIHPLTVSKKNAEVNVEALLNYKPHPASADESAGALLSMSVVDSEGNTVLKEEKKVTVKDSGTVHAFQKIDIKNPRLWDARRNPYMYTLKVSLENAEGKKVDEVDQPLGLRFFHVSRDSGFILNGRPYDLYGVCYHADLKGVGDALTNSEYRRDMKLIDELGAHGVRFGHTQQADIIYHLCDKDGLVVWTEIPNTPRYRATVPAYLQNCVQQLTELIKQNYNHPSICFWGLYNEINISAKDLRVLNDVAKRLDPSRLTTQADKVPVANDSDRHFVTDVAAWNWYFGWYYGNFNDYNTWFTNLHKKYPQLKAGLSEYGASGCVSQQEENPKRPNPLGRWYPEQYQRYFHEQAWKILKKRPDIWCKFIWNMFDFSWTFAVRGAKPYMNYKGLVTYDRKVKKDAFYFYKANWSDEPVLHICDSRNVNRKDPVTSVDVYTNLDKVKLYLNGKLVSEKNMNSVIHKISWKDVRLRPGANYVSAIGYKDGKTFTDHCRWNYVKQSPTHSAGNSSHSKEG